MFILTQNRKLAFEDQDYIFGGSDEGIESSINVDTREIIQDYLVCNAQSDKGTLRIPKFCDAMANRVDSGRYGRGKNY